MPKPPPLPCPVCAALVFDHPGHIDQHVTWHEGTKTLGPKRGSYSTADGLRLGFADVRSALALADVQDDDAATAKLPPIADTIRRRPPVPSIRELSGPDLVRALMAELENELQDGDDL